MESTRRDALLATRLYTWCPQGQHVTLVSESAEAVAYDVTVRGKRTGRKSDGTLRFGESKVIRIVHTYNPNIPDREQRLEHRVNWDSQLTDERVGFSLSPQKRDDRAGARAVKAARSAGFSAEEIRKALASLVNPSI